MAWIACRWCHTRLELDANPGWYSCECKAVSVDIGKGYYRVLSFPEDIELGGK